MTQETQERAEAQDMSVEEMVDRARAKVRLAALMKKHTAEDLRALPPRDQLEIIIGAIKDPRLDGSALAEIVIAATAQANGE